MNIADAKARLSEIVGRAEAGETVTIERRGRPVAKLVPYDQLPDSIDVEVVRAMVARFTKPGPLPGNPVIAMRDESPY